MIDRPFWLHRIEAAWKEAPIVWLCGVRRAGKTTLAQQLGEARVHYVNCDLPIVEDMVSDPQLFYRGCAKPVVVFDEIHQLRDPQPIAEGGRGPVPAVEDFSDRFLDAGREPEVSRHAHRTQAPGASDACAVE